MSLTSVENFKGSKNKHPTTRCICDCGNERIVRTTRLKNGLVTSCVACARKDAARKGGITRKQYSDEEVILRERLSQYRNNAKRKNRKFLLTESKALEILHSACTYCGISPAMGIDRKDNADDYSEKNSVACCGRCNFAKRDMSQKEFTEFIVQVFRYFCIS